MKLAVVVGRFQTYGLHQGHIDVLKRAIFGSDTLLVLIGSPWKTPSHNNPLPFEVRQKLVKEALEAIYQRNGKKPSQIMPFADNRNNKIWVAYLDHLIYVCYPHAEVILYCGRDSGVNKVYKDSGGEHKIVVIEDKLGSLGISATRQREELLLTPEAIHPPSVIWTTQQQYTKVYPSVDCVLRDKGGFIVLIKKKNESKWRFPGGFVDPSDNSYEMAVRREVAEECGVEITDLRYVASLKVDDWRYRGEKDKIITTLFAANVCFGLPKAGDDAAELLGFDDMGVEQALIEEHKPLWETYEEWRK